MPVFQHSVWLFTEFLRKHFPKIIFPFDQSNNENGRTYICKEIYRNELTAVSPELLLLWKMA